MRKNVCDVVEDVDLLSEVVLEALLEFDYDKDLLDLVLDRMKDSGDLLFSALIGLDELRIGLAGIVNERRRGAVATEIIEATKAEMAVLRAEIDERVKECTFGMKEP